MKTFLLKDGIPTIKFSLLPDEIYYQGEVPKGYNLAICPSPYIVVDIDKKGKKNGFDHIPDFILDELESSFHYYTKSGGMHIFLDYTGSKVLKNTSTKFGIDLRIGEKGTNAGGYVKYNHSVDIKECKCLIKKTSNDLNNWLELIFV